MNSFGTKVFSVVLILGAAISINVLALADKKCKGLPITMTEAQMKNLKFCADKIGVASPEQMTPDKLPCFSKCIMEKKGLVDDQGKPHKENINALIDSTMPEPVRGDMKTSMAKCLDQHGSKIDAKDATCMSYGPLSMCTMKEMMAICK